MRNVDDKLVSALAGILQVNAEYNVKITKVGDILGGTSCLDGLYIDLLPFIFKILDIDEIDLVVDDFFGHIEEYTSLEKCYDLIHAIIEDKANNV